MTDNYPERPVSPFAGGYFNPFSDYGYSAPTTGDGSGDGGGGNKCKKNKDCNGDRICVDGVCTDPTPDGGTPDDGGETAPDGTRCRPRCGPNKKCRGGVCVPRQGNGQGNGNGNNNGRRRRRNNRQADAMAAFGGATETTPSFRSFTGLGFTPGGDPGAMSADLSGQGWGSGSSSGMAEYTPPPNPFFTPAQRQAPAQQNPFITPVAQDNPFMPRRRR